MQSAGGVDANGSSEATSVDFEQVSMGDVRDAGSVVKATRKLGLEVLAHSPKDTLVTSPVSTVVALATLGATATGEAEDQLSLLLGASGEERNKVVNALLGTLDSYRVPADQIDTEDLPEDPQVHLANQMVLDTGFKVERTYQDALKRWFNTGTVEAELGDASGKKVLDEWVRENTAGLIEKSAIEPDPDLRLVLQNAIVLASKWQQPFMADMTAPAEFHSADGTLIEVDFLNGSQQVNYAEADGWQMVELPYGSDGRLVAHFVLPPEGTPAATVTTDILGTLEGGLVQKMVDVSIPKLDLKTSVTLNDPLQKAGLTSVFTDNPPALQYISTAESLVVSEVIQQGSIRVDEAGTVAAAVTEIGVRATMMPPEPEVSFVANRPYLMLITDTNTGWDLFQVLVNSPTGK